MAEEENGTETGLLGGRLRLRQPLTGHRAGTDAVLLAAAADVPPGCTFVDVGAGVGTVGLALAAREATATGLLIERSPEMAELARGNAALNRLSARLTVESFDIFNKQARAEHAEKADLVVSNPPFYAPAENRASPDDRKASAHMLSSPSLPAPPEHGDWLRAMLSFLAPGGTLLMIHRPEALPRLLAAAEGRLGQMRIRAVQARENTPAIRILLAGLKGSRAPLVFQPALVLHGPGQSFTPEAEAIHRGDLFCPLLETKKSRPRRPASCSSLRSAQQTRTRRGP